MLNFITEYSKIIRAKGFLNKNANKGNANYDEIR